jgi:septum formation protein
MHMPEALILASGSEIRAQLLRNANVAFEAQTPRLDEETIKQSLLAEQALPRDIADALAEGKAAKIASKTPNRLVLGCDQVLEHRGSLLSKPTTEEDAFQQLKTLQGDRHSLLSAAVIYEDGRPVWRHVGQVRLRMRDASDDYLKDYVTRNWNSIRFSVGSYKLEEEGVRLFTRVDGDYFTVLGMPLLEILSYLTLRGYLEA